MNVRTRLKTILTAGPKPRQCWLGACCKTSDIGAPNTSGPLFLALFFSRYVHVRCGPFQPRAARCQTTCMQKLPCYAACPIFRRCWVLDPNVMPSTQKHSRHYHRALRGACSLTSTIVAAGGSATGTASTNIPQTPISTARGITVRTEQANSHFRLNL